MGKEYYSHMTLKSFGAGISPYSETSPFLHLIKTGTIKDDITQQLEMMEEYDRTYGLYDHSASDDLMSVMFLHPEEDPVTGSRMEVFITELISLRLPELLQEGIVSILTNFPMWYLEKLMDQVRKIREGEKNVIKDLTG